MNVRFCWCYEPFLFFLKDSPGREPSPKRSGRVAKQLGPLLLLLLFALSRSIHIHGERGIVKGRRRLAHLLLPALLSPFPHFPYPPPPPSPVPCLCPRVAVEVLELCQMQRKQYEIIEKEVEALKKANPMQLGSHLKIMTDPQV